LLPPDLSHAISRQPIHHSPSPQVTVPQRAPQSARVLVSCGTSVLYSPADPQQSRNLPGLPPRPPPIACSLSTGRIAPCTTPRRLNHQNPTRESRCAHQKRRWPDPTCSGRTAPDSLFADPCLVLIHIIQVSSDVSPHVRFSSQVNAPRMIRDPWCSPGLAAKGLRRSPGSRW